jgi:hypothetical protein
MGCVIAVCLVVLTTPMILILSPMAAKAQQPTQQVPPTGITRLDQMRPLPPGAKPRKTFQEMADEARNKPEPQPYVIPKGEGDAYVPPRLKTNFGKTPSTHNLSGNDYMQEPPPDPGAYSPQLEARAFRMFPSISQEQERQQWMADQEQRAIANEINRTKPLLYPASGR